MTRRLFNIAAAASLMLLGLSLAAGIAGRFFPFDWPEQHYLTAAHNVFVTMDRGFGGDFLVGRLAVFNNVENGIYRGSIWTLGPLVSNRIYVGGTLGIWCTTETEYGRKDFNSQKFNLQWPGIYYRSFVRLPPALPDVWRTCLVSMWYPIAAFSVLPLVWVWKRHFGRKWRKIDSL
jgi:hypothetical protein